MEETKETKPEFVKSELAKYDEGFVPEYRNRKMTVEIVDAGKIPDVSENDSVTGGEKVVAQTQEAQPATPIEKKEKKNISYGPGKINVGLTGKTLKEVLAVIKAADTEAVFKFRKDGISVLVIDPDHVMMASMEIPKNSLIEYWYDTEADKVRVGLDVERLMKLMPYNKDDAIDLHIETYNNAARGKLTVDNGSIKAAVDTLDVESIKDLREPLISTDDYAVLPAKKFRDVLRTAALITDHVKIEFDRETVTVRTESDDGSAETVFSRDEMKELKVTNPGKAVYPLDYLINIMKTVKTDEIKISLKQDYPIKIESYLMPSRGGEKNIYVKYLLAPRMEE